MMGKTTKIQFTTTTLIIQDKILWKPTQAGHPTIGTHHTTPLLDQT